MTYAAYLRRRHMGPARAETALAEVGRWLEGFHPYSLIELDSGCSAATR
jgi:hypothetical protein